MIKEKCKKCGSENIIMIEYSWDSPEHYDGISLKSNISKYANGILPID